MPSFDIIVVGCGGGPYESNLSGYLFKAADSVWEDEQVIGLEAGSGMGALDGILKLNPDLFGSDPDTDKPYTAAQIYSFLRCYLISHSHLDHISSLVLSTGSLGTTQKRIYARKQTLKNLEDVFADRLWPKLASYNKDDEHVMLVYRTLPADGNYFKINREISVCSMPLTHGLTMTMAIYESTAFFIRNNISKEEFLFFGDVEPDSISSKPQTIDVWKTAASKIPGTLTAIFIECSWPSGREDKMLYGHLSPQHLVDELVVLAKETYRFNKLSEPKSNGDHSEGTQNGPGTRSRKKKRLNSISLASLRGVLNGLPIYIMHCKGDVDGIYDRPINHIIADQVKELLEGKELGVQVIAVEQGMHIRI